MSSKLSRELHLRRTSECWVGEFRAMACPCELLIETEDRDEARRVLGRVAEEAWRVEQKFSRYRSDNVVHAINHSQGKAVTLDEETARMLDFAAQLHALSEGRFDITSGVLRRAWKFDGSDRVPTADQVDQARSAVGWERVTREDKCITLEPGMQIDLGGIGKEYAVDRAAQIAAATSERGSLVNFGGDLCVGRPRAAERSWAVGIEMPDEHTSHTQRRISLTSGALATSGDWRRFLLKDGVRYSHILDPTTGWPVQGGPRSVTVIAGSCVEAGMMATLAMLQAKDARAYLEGEAVRFWIVD